MNWGRAKTILIVMFLAVDIFLLFVLIQTRQGAMQLPVKTVEETYAILENNGILIEPNIIPVKRAKNRNILMRNYFEEPQEAAKAMLGQFETVLADEDAHAFQFAGITATLSVQNSNFTYVNQKRMKPYEESQVPDNKLQEEMAERLRKMGFSKETTAICDGKMQNGLYVFHAVPLYKGMKIHGISMYIEADSEAILNMEGNWFYPQAVENFEEEPLLDVTSVLSGFIFRKDNWPEQILQVEYAYYASGDYLKSREIAAMPVYAITDGNHKTLYFDSRSGGVVE